MPWSALTNVGWHVEPASMPMAMPAAVVERHPWVPRDVLDAVRAVSAVRSPDGRAWFLTAADFAGITDLARPWDVWERECVAWAAGDAAEIARVHAFWDDHLPLLHSVKTGYAYFALQRGTLHVVRAQVVEAEDTTYVAASLEALIALIAADDGSLSVWI